MPGSHCQCGTKNRLIERHGKTSRITTLALGPHYAAPSVQSLQTWFVQKQHALCTSLKYLHLDYLF